MTDLELAETLYIADDGEIKSFPQHAKSLRVIEPVMPKARLTLNPDEVFTYSTREYRPVWSLPEPVQRALAALYREREKMEQLASDWCDEFVRHGWPGHSESASELMQRSRGAGIGPYKDRRR